MYEDLTFLSERQNILLLEKVFSSTSYKEMKEFLDTFDFQQKKFYQYVRQQDSPVWFESWVRTLGHQNIHLKGHLSQTFTFRIPNEGVADLTVYLFSGDNYKPIPIIYYYYPVKMFLNLPFMKLYRDISNCVDLKSHRVTKDSFVQFGKVFTELYNSKAVIKIEPVLLKYFEGYQPVLKYTFDLWQRVSLDWESQNKRQIGIIKSGSVVTSFRVSVDGKITNPRVLSNTANESLAANCLYSLINTYMPPMSQEQKELLTTDYLDLKFCFTFYEDEKSFVYIV